MNITKANHLKYLHLLGEIGDIHRFSSPHKLLAYAGLNSSVRQSENIRATHTRMSKRGSKGLSYVLINATHNVVKNNATFKAYYYKKMAEAGLTTMLSGIVPTSSSVSSGK